jgi:hypothetical protein
MSQSEKEKRVRKPYTVLGSVGALAVMLALTAVPAAASTHSRAASKVAPTRVTARVTPHRIAHAPYTYTLSGAVDAGRVCPAGNDNPAYCTQDPGRLCPSGTDNPAYCVRAPCRGEVRITIHLPHGQTLLAQTRVSDACKFSKTVTIPDRKFRVTRHARHKVFTLAFEARYLGNSVLSAKSAPTVHAKAVGFHA